MKYESARESVMADLRDHFRPEFLNRIDDTVLFKPLLKKLLSCKSLAECPQYET